MNANNSPKAFTDEDSDTLKKRLYRNASSTPWQVGNTRLGDCAIYPKGDRAPICIFTHEDVSDATFIVRAVNCHEELLQACKWAFHQLEARGHSTRPLGSAIAKAEWLEG